MGSSRKCCLILICLLMISGISFSQTNDRFTRITIEDGLSQNSISSIIKDKNGFIWIGTKDGLNKYDAYSFTTYRYDKNDTTSLSGNIISSIVEDKNGYLWVGTWDGGLNKFDPKTEKSIRYVPSEGDLTSVASNQVEKIILSANGGLWISFLHDGICYYDPETEYFTTFKHIEGDTTSLSHNEVSTIFEDNNQTLWVATRYNTLDTLNRETGAFQSVSLDYPIPDYNIPIFIVDIYQDKSGKMYFAHYEVGLVEYNPVNKKWSVTAPIDRKTGVPILNHLNVIIEDIVGNLWLGTSLDGLFKLNRKTKTLTNYNYSPYNESTIGNRAVNSLLVDESNLLWVGTNGGGIATMNLSSKRFSLISKKISNPEAPLCCESIRAIYEDTQGFLWIGGYGGLSKIKRHTNGTFSVIRSDFDIVGDVYVIKKDPTEQDVVWIGTENNGLYKFSTKSGEVLDQFSTYSKSGNVLITDYIFSLFTEYPEWIYFGSSSGLYQYNKRTEKLTFYTNDPNDPKSITADAVYSIEHDQYGNIWVGTSTGLNRFDPVSGMFKSFTNSEDDPHSLSSNAVKCTYEDKNGTLWIGTNGGGLNRFNRVDESFTHITVDDGLPNNVIYGILEDDASNLWMSTNKGLVKYNTITSEIIVFDVSEGLQSNEFNSSAYYKSEDGEMFFGGIKGLNAFYPNNIKKNFYIPPIVITSFKIYYEEIQQKNNISFVEHITIPYDRNLFTIEFAALNFINSTKNEYAYRLKKFDDRWIYIGNQRTATFTNLDPGTYTFQVKGSNNDGIWNENGTSLRITVLSPYWQSWWFRAIIAALLILLFFLLYRYNSQRIYNRNIQRTISLLRSTIEATADAILIVDANKNVLFSNKKFLSILGVDDQEALDSRKLFSKGFYKMKLKNPEVLIRSIIGLNTNKDKQMFEYLEFLDGRVIELFTAPFYAGNIFAGRVWSFRDLTERKQLESQFFLQSSALKAAANSFIILNAKRIIEWINPSMSNMTLYSAEELVGNKLCIVKSDKHPDEFYENIWNTVENGNTWHGEIFTKRKDGSEFPEEMTITPVKNDEGEIINYIAVKQDITERKENEKRIKKYTDELKELNASKDKFFSIISHDLKNPFQALISLSQTILSYYDRISEEKKISYVKQIESASKNTYELLENLLQWSRAQTGAIKLQPEDIDLHTISWETIQLLKANAQHKNILLENNIPVNSYVYADRNMVTTIFRNLITNGIKYTFEGGKVTMDAEEYEGFYSVRIKDTGTGMSKNKIENLFKLEERVSQAGTAKERGTGLGLILCKEFIEMNKGSISAESQLGEGSVFTVNLPKAT